jgi:hypothetical protein
VADDDKSEPAEPLDQAERDQIKARVEAAEKKRDGSSAANSNNKRHKTGKTMVEHGLLDMKVHQVIESELDDLGRMSRDASIYTASATGLAGFALDLAKDLLLASGAQLGRVMLFVGVDVMCWIGAAYFAVLAVHKWRERGEKVKLIKSRTKFVSDGTVSP